MLSLYFDPDTDAETRLAMREEFVRALASYPEWAMQRAFDQWVKTNRRRPSPGEIAILAQQEIAPLVTELRKRAAPQDQGRDLSRRVTPQAAAEIIARAGFGPRVMGERKPHWSDAIQPGQENDAEAIRRAKINAGVADA